MSVSKYVLHTNSAHKIITTCILGYSTFVLKYFSNTMAPNPFSITKKIQLGNQINEC